MSRLSIFFIPVALWVAFTSSALAAPSQTTLAVEHMDCVSCPVVVRAALYDLEGVESVQVSMENKTVNVEYDDQTLSDTELAEAVTNAGFPAKVAD